ncbi:MAG: hypothetical protein WAL97_05615, partial [Halobacteriota archaeon]
LIISRLPQTGRATALITLQTVQLLHTKKEAIAARWRHHRHKKLVDGQSSDNFTVVLDLHSCINNPNDAALTQHFMVLL